MQITVWVLVGAPLPMHIQSTLIGELPPSSRCYCQRWLKKNPSLGNRVAYSNRTVCSPPGGVRRGEKSGLPLGVPGISWKCSAALLEGTEAKAVHGSMEWCTLRFLALATAYKWVSFSLTSSASLVGDSSQSGRVPLSTCRCGFGCGRLGSGVMSCRRRCRKKREKEGVLNEIGRDVNP